MKFIISENLRIEDEDGLRTALLKEMSKRNYYFYYENFFSPPNENDSTSELINNYFQELCSYINGRELYLEKKSQRIADKNLSIFTGFIRGYIEWYDDTDSEKPVLHKDYFLKDRIDRVYAKIDYE